MNFFNKLPNSAKGIVAVMAMCGPVVTLAALSQPQLMRWYLGIYVFLGVVGAVGALVLAKKEKKKSESFSKEINVNAGDNQGIRDPEKIREVDDLRQQFERGLDIYRQYGKDIYSLPWFVVVGESGSGKTEALRRSELGFPDKLQDYWQGTGGTLSMHWWFTNNGVILDTAGRFFVNDGPSTQGPQAQWVSFLKLLRKNRPECPINGVVLVIPADSLIPGVDPAEESSSLLEIDSKAGQIARQMEVLRSELGVRFPVYILITKTDRILGFREFFETIETPAERHQMLGWSNPAGIDEKFDPAAVARHLADTADRLRGRRMALLKDPVANPGSRGRIEEVDAMYALPESFERLAPKLERYLRSLFVADQWSAPPHFLRGIYFTSALQQGAVLDEALARALGQTMGEMKRGGGGDDLSLARNRSYFLRDFFLEKVFLESGLVVKSGRKAVGKGRGWKFWLPVSFASAMVAFLLLGWFTGRRPSPEVEAWRFLANEAYSTANYGFYPIITKGGRSGGWQYSDRPVDAETLVSKLQELGAENLDGSPRLGWLFAPATLLDGGVKEGRKSAYVVAVDQIVLRPLLEAAIDNLEQRSQHWIADGVSRSEREAFQCLLGLYDERSKRGADDLRSDIEALTKILGLSNDYRRHRSCLAPMKDAAVLAHPDGRIPNSLVSERDKSRLVSIISNLMNAGGGDVESLLENFHEQWTKLQDVTDISSAKERVAGLRIASASLKRAEPQLRAMASGSPPESDGGEVVGGKFAGFKLAGEILRDQESILEALCGKKQVETWWGIFNDSAAGESERSMELFTQHAALLPNDPEGRRYHEARASLCLRILELGDDPPLRWNLMTGDQIISGVDELQKLAGDIGMPDEGRVLLSIAAAEYVSEVIAEVIGFPLVHAVRADQGSQVEELDAEAAAGISAVCLKLGSVSGSARNRLGGVLKIAGSIFNLEELTKPSGQRGGLDKLVRDWKVELSGGAGFEMDVAEVRISVLAEGEGLGGTTWIPADNIGKEAVQKIIRADRGGRAQFRDVLADKWHDFDGEEVPKWAVVHWFIRQLKGAGNGVTGNFNGRSFGLKATPPEDGSFPRQLEDLPSVDDLKP